MLGSEDLRVASEGNFCGGGEKQGNKEKLVGSMSWT